MTLDPRSRAAFSTRVLRHYRSTNREIPWRGSTDPYAIWISEIMAQQTRIAAVIPYWHRWMARFPTVRELAAAPQDDVLAAWAGLGYYARARSLHRAAQEIVAQHGGRLPDDVEGLAALPGIGRYTAGAIASIAFGRRAAVVDGNVARVFARHFGLEDDVRRPATMKRLWELADELVPAKGAGDYNQGLMDLGATVCLPKRAHCDGCPLASTCVARATGRQAELPVMGARSAVREVEVEAAWIVRGGRWLLARRASRGLFGGLWELPDLAAFPAGHTPTVDRRRPIAEHTHALSHRTIRYRVFRARLGRPAQATSGGPHLDAPEGARTYLDAPYEEARFFSPTQVASLGVSSATAALASALGRATPRGASRPE